MRVCDLCKNPSFFPVKIPVIKEEKHARRAGPKGADKTVITIDMDLCDPCLTKFTREFGHFITRFRKGTQDDKVEGTEEKEEEVEE
jgi:hypothetical protein